MKYTQKNFLGQLFIHSFNLGTFYIHAILNFDFFTIILQTKARPIIYISANDGTQSICNNTKSKMFFFITLLIIKSTLIKAFTVECYSNHKYRNSFTCYNYKLLGCGKIRTMCNSYDIRFSDEK